MTPERLRIDGRDTQRDDRFLALATSPNPRISWIVPLVRDGQRQTGLEAVIVDPGAGPDTGEAIWRSGTVDSEDPWIRVDAPLPPNGLYDVTVRTRDDQNRWSAWAPPVPLETGPHELADWGAGWITQPALSVIRRPFTLETAPVRARLHLTAQGLVRASLGGVAVNDSASDPSRTDIARALFRSYDVTDLVHAGQNTLDLAIAHGDWEHTGLDPRLLATVVVTDATGGVHTFGADTELLRADGPVVIEQRFYLERQQLGLQPSFEPLADAGVLEAVPHPSSADEPPLHVRVDPGPPLQVIERIVPVPLSPQGPGTRLFDVGTNIAGRTRIVVRSGSAPGTVVRVVHGEHIDDAGRLDTTNLTMPFDHGRVRQAVEYVLSGAPDEVLEAWFCYHGFRYFEVTGLPADAWIDVAASTIHSDLTPTGTLRTDSTAVETLLERARRTLLNNVHGIPEDCPTREQSGWTGDTASVTEFEFAAFDVQAFFAKWLGDLRTSQQPDGAIPAISPDIRPEKVPADPVWGAALQRTLEAHWLHYGDLAVVHETLPALRAWVDFQWGCRTPDGVVGASPISFGHDWLALQQTPPEVHHTAATLDSLRVLADFEDLVGEHSAAERRRSQSQSLRDAARAAFIDPDRGTIGNGSQGSLACALESGWLDDTEARRVSGTLAEDVRGRGNRLSSGFATTRTVVRALAHHGGSQALFDALHQRAEPGIGAMLDHGPGTFWECWWIDPENTGTGSLDHVGLGGPFAGWAWQHLAGLRPVAAGYSRFVVEPVFVDGLNRVDLDVETVRGAIALSLRREGTHVDVTLTVPVGSEAVVRLPNEPERVVGPGRHAFSADVTVPTRIGAPVEASPWRAPSWAPRASDVVGEDDLLASAIADGRFEAIGETSEIVVRPEGVRCMPIPHAQLAGPMLLVRGADSPEPTGPGVRVSFNEPLDLSGTRFVFALLDFCLDVSGRPLESELRIVSANGSAHSSIGRVWPAGWNRVSAELSGWSGSSRVVAIEVSARHTPSPESGEGVPRPPAVFHLGGIGWSSVRRTAP